MFQRALEFAITFLWSDVEVGAVGKVAAAEEHAFAVVVDHVAASRSRRVASGSSRTPRSTLS